MPARALFSKMMVWIILLLATFAAPALAQNRIFAGPSSTCAELPNDSNHVMCWGDNAYSQLGDATYEDRSLPVPSAAAADGYSISIYTGFDFDIALGSGHACSAQSDNKVRCWGDNFSGQIGDGTTTASQTAVLNWTVSDVFAIAGGASHTCAAFRHLYEYAAGVSCWGSGIYGQLGDGSVRTNLYPNRVLNLPDPSRVVGLPDVVAITSGAWHTCVLDSETNVHCWGRNDTGALGDGTTQNRLSPVQVAGLTNVKSIAAADWHTCAVLKNGTVKCWGGDYGFSPTTVEGVAGVQQITAGAEHTCVVLQDSSVKCWGYNGVGSLGDGTILARATPVTVIGLNDVTSISAGGYHTCAFKADDSLYCWGMNDKGQLGNGTLVNSATPISVTFPQSITWTQPLAGVAGQDVTLTAQASSGLSVAYSTTTPTICSVDGSTLHPLSQGVCSIKAEQAGNSTRYNAALAVTREFTVKLPQSIQWTQSLSGRINDVINLAATSTSTLLVTYAASGACSLTGTALTLTSVGTCTVTATQAGDTVYMPARPVTLTGSVSKIPQNITWTQELAGALGGSITLTAAVDTGKTITYSAIPATICTVAGSTLSLITGGTCYVTASVASDGTYAAVSQQRNFDVAKLSQTVIWGQTPVGAVGTSLKLTATTSSGLPVRYFASPASVCSISQSTATLLAVGTCTLTAEQPGTSYYYPAELSKAFNVSIGSQTISWPQGLSGAVGDTITLAATASSGLIISYASSTTSICTVSGSTLKIVAVGSCVVTASQAGSVNYLAAPVVTKSFNVTMGSQTISWTQGLSGAVGNTITLAATASSGLTVSYVSGTTAVCTVSGTTLKLIAAGVCTVTATQAGSPNYAAATSVSRSFTVSIGSQTITWGQTLSGSVGTSLSLNGTASSGLTVAYASSTNNICTVNGSTLRLLAVGSCVVTASQPGSANYFAAPVVSKMFSVAIGSQTISWTQGLSGAAGNTITLTATASSGLTVSYVSGTTAVCTVSGTTLKLIAAGVCTVTATQAGSPNYAAATSVSRSFTVSVGSQTISWTQTLSGSTGSTIRLTATASSGLPVVYSSSSTTVCTVTTSVLTLVASGTCKISASQAGNVNYTAAMPVSRSFSVVATAIAVTPTRLDFTSQPITTTSATKKLTVINNTGYRVVFSAPALQGIDTTSFLVSSTCATLAPSASCAVSVAFKPVTTGPKTATLSLASNAAGSPTTIVLSGSAVAAAPIISLTPSSLSFGNQLVGITSLGKNLTIKNTGSATLTISSYVMGGVNPTSFLRSGTCSSLAAGASCSISVAFKPAATGALSATLAINSNAYGSPTTTVNAAGTGVIASLSLFAGAIDGPGFANGAASAARFYGPSALAVDANNNVYVVESGNNLVRQITSAGNVTTLAGQTLRGGFQDGTGSGALFWRPQGLAISGTTLYVADTLNHVIRKLTTTGTVSTFVGTAGMWGYKNATGTSARFDHPSGVVLDSLGNLFVADTANGVIRKVTSAGAVSHFAGSLGTYGGTNGTGSAASFKSPTGMTRDSANNLYVTDTGANTIRKVTPTAAVTTLAGSYGLAGSANGTGSAARFSRPQGAVVGANGNIYIADSGNHTIRQSTPTGVVTTFAGTAGATGTVDGAGSAARFMLPTAMARDSIGNLYVADHDANVIRKITSKGVTTTFAGYPAATGKVDNTGSLARFLNPSSIVVDAAGNTFVADTGNHTIRKITPAGVVSTFAGGAGLAGYADGTGTAARFRSPYGLTIDTAGTVYVADSGNHAIRRITSAGVVSTIAGSAGSYGSSDGIGANARFYFPAALTWTKSGLLYVADTYNYTIRKIVLSTSQVSTLAGTAGFYGSFDGTGGGAAFTGVLGIAVDSSGNVFAADAGANTIRKISPLGVVTTFAGSATATGAADGYGTAARFAGPGAMTIDPSNNLYVTDFANCMIRRITPAAGVTTLLGTRGACKFSVGNAPSSINMPGGVAVLGRTLYFTAGHGVGKVVNIP